MNANKCYAFHMICDRTPKIDIRKLAKMVDTIPKVVDFAGERLVTTWTNTAFGGQRPWFLCPSCDRRCAIIYRIGVGPLWGCRICLNGRYISEHLSPSDRELHKAFKTRARLGQRKGGILVPFPDKPPSMHWQTYKNICRNAQALEQVILLKAQADL